MCTLENSTVPHAKRLRSRSMPAISATTFCRGRFHHLNDTPYVFPVMLVISLPFLVSVNARTRARNSVVFRSGITVRLRVKLNQSHATGKACRMTTVSLTYCATDGFSDHTGSAVQSRTVRCRLLETRFAGTPGS
nr:hypothetical protein CFP56_09227 [Quercus suber]